MSPQRKIYETRSQKVVDFFIGVGLIIGINIAIGLLSALLMGLMGALSSSPGTNAGTVFELLSAGVMSVFYCLPFLLNIGAIIYFSLTRYWIALGMLAVIAFGMLIAVLLSAACFILLGGGLAGWF